MTAPYDEDQWRGADTEARLAFKAATERAREAGCPDDGHFTIGVLRALLPGVLHRAEAAGLAQGRAEGGEEMRERAAMLVEVVGQILDMHGDQSAATVLYNVAAKVRALPTDTTAREAERGER